MDGVARSSCEPAAVEHLDHLEAPDRRVGHQPVGRVSRSRKAISSASRIAGEARSSIALTSASRLGQGEPAAGVLADQAGRREQAVEVGVGQRGRVERLDVRRDAGVDA